MSNANIKLNLTEIKNFTNHYIYFTQDGKLKLQKGYYNPFYDFEKWNSQLITMYTKILEEINKDEELLSMVYTSIPKLIEIAKYYSSTKVHDVVKLVEENTYILSYAKQFYISSKESDENVEIAYVEDDFKIKSSEITRTESSGFINELDKSTATVAAYTELCDATVADIVHRSLTEPLDSVACVSPETPKSMVRQKSEPHPPNYPRKKTLTKVSYPFKEKCLKCYLTIKSGFNN